MPHKPDANILEASLIVVPNMNLAKWIKLTLARQRSVFMNVEFAYLEKGLWQMISALGHHAEDEAEMLDREWLTILVFFILMSLDNNNTIVEPILNYLRRPDGLPLADGETRCWQLAEKLSRLFQEYEYHRADMVQGWGDGRVPADVMEACQCWVYNQVQHLKSRLGPVLGRSMMTINEYARCLPVPSAPVTVTSGMEDGPRVHFFGLSQISPLHIDLLSRLQTGFDIHIYSLNPSREYWEDIETPGEKRWFACKNVSRLQFSGQEWSTGELFEPADHELLSLWGKPGRENIRLLCQLTDYDFEAGFSDRPYQKSVLGIIHHGLLTLETPVELNETPQSQDTSLQITACPSIRREVETVYNSILYNLEIDPNLCMTDIAVMVPDMGRYKPVVDSIFGRHPARITYNLVDASARTESVFAQAVLSFMALARGRFSRKAVFDFLRNPCVMQRWRYTPEALAVWIEWAAALGIYYGFETGHDDTEPVPEAGLFSWRQGLERLRLSRIMRPPEATTAHPRPHFNGLVPFSDINTGDHRLLETFGMIVSALHTSVACFKAGTNSARDWRDTFLQVIDQFIEISPDMRGEESVRQSLFGAFEYFVHYDLLREIDSEQRLSSEGLWAFVKSHLEGITGGRGDYLTGGVTVSALMPMRPIPFKIIYIMGLEEGRFPGRSTDSLLDLRARQRRIGDVSLTERNRYLFLEILISAQKKLYLSYVSRDLQKDRNLAPCSVVQQLRRHIERRVIGNRQFQIQQVPIKATSHHYLTPDAITDWSDVMVNENTLQRLVALRRSGGWDAAAARLGDAEREAVLCHEPDLTFPQAPEPVDQPTTASLTAGWLRRFLLDPVTVYGQYHVGAHELIDDTSQLAEVEDEPLASRFPVDFEIRTTPVKNWLAHSIDDMQDEPSIHTLKNEFNSLYVDQTRKSRVPCGAFADNDRQRLVGEVMAYGQLLLPYIQAMRSARQLFSALNLGSTTIDEFNPTGIQLNLDPLVLELSDRGTGSIVRTVQISGGLPWIWQAKDLGWHCLVVTGSGQKPSDPDKYVLEPVIVFMAAIVCGKSRIFADANRLTVNVVYREQVLQHAYRFEKDRCRVYLQQLVEDFFTPAPMVWLPFGTIFGHRSLLRYVKQDEISDLDRQSFAGALQEAMQEADDPLNELFDATVPPDILDLARRRFRLFLPAR